MSKEFKIPELGEGVESATVARILVSEGDAVEKDQSVVELETEKAATEVPCDSAGKVKKIHVEEGDEIKVGETVLTLEETNDSEAGDKENQEEKPESEESDNTPDEDETDSEEKKPEAKSDDKEETQKKPAKTEEPPGADEEADEDGDDEEDADEGDEEEEDEDKEMRAGEEEAPEGEEESPKKRSADLPIPAAPSVRRFAREIGVYLSTVQGSGEHGQISINDVKAQARSSSGSESAAPELPDFSKWGDIEREPMSKVRQLTAEQMVRAASIIPQAIQFGKADITKIEKLREQYAADAEEAGGHLSLTVILIKTVVGALKMFPRFNASLDPEKKEIIYKKYVHIGIAMDTDRGLLVPVIRDADKMNVIELAVELRELTEKGRAGKLKAEDMRGASLTITNAGALGGDLFIPIVNWPEVAILGVAKTRTEPVFLNGAFQPRQILPLSLAYDHRLIDGADAVRFMRWLTKALEDPIKLAWEG